MGALDGLHVEVKGARCGIRANGGIARICERAGLAIAEAGDVVFVATEILLFWCSVEDKMSTSYFGAYQG